MECSVSDFLLFFLVVHRSLMLLEACSLTSFPFPAVSDGDVYQRRKEYVLCCWCFFHVLSLFYVLAVNNSICNVLTTLYDIVLLCRMLLCLQAFHDKRVHLFVNDVQSSLLKDLKTDKEFLVMGPAMFVFYLHKHIKRCADAQGRSLQQELDIVTAEFDFSQILIPSDVMALCADEHSWTKDGFFPMGSSGFSFSERLTRTVRGWGTKEEEKKVDVVAITKGVVFSHTVGGKGATNGHASVWFRPSFSLHPHLHEYLQSEFRSSAFFPLMFISEKVNRFCIVGFIALGPEVGKESYKDVVGKVLICSVSALPL